MPGTFSPRPTSKKTASCRSRHASWHVRDARAVMHVGIAKSRGGETFPAFPAHVQPAILRIWKEAHVLEGHSVSISRLLFILTLAILKKPIVAILISNNHVVTKIRQSSLVTAGIYMGEEAVNNLVHSSEVKDFLVVLAEVTHCTLRGMITMHMYGYHSSVPFIHKRCPYMLQDQYQYTDVMNMFSTSARHNRVTRYFYNTINCQLSLNYFTFIPRRPSAMFQKHGLSFPEIIHKY